MKRSVHAMEGKLFDVVVIGGGINGTGVARDSAMRGLNVALIDKGDFGRGTTSRSTRLAHGGLRYLEMFDFALVREGLRERELLLKNAPHLVSPVPFITPVYNGSRRGPTMIKIGMRLYDFLSYDKSVPSYRWHSKESVSRLEPGLHTDGLIGGALYYDARIDLPERLCIENIQSAHQHGAEAANYVEMISVNESSQGEYMEVRVKDLLTGESHTINGRVVVNATGPWSDQLGLPGVDRVLRTTKGVHIVVPKLTDHAIVMLAGRDGRLFFCIPWMGYSLIGTTDTDYEGNPGEARAEYDDVTYLVTETKRFFPDASIEPIYSTMAGVRPLVRQRGRKVSESAVSRKHIIMDSCPEKGYGIVSVSGGKLTNFRSVCEEVTNQVCEKLGKKIKGRTRFVPMYGGDIKSVDESLVYFKKEFNDLNLPDDAILNIVKLYGSRGSEILNKCRNNPELTRPLADGMPHIMAQVNYGVAEEMVRTSADFLMRRTGIGFLPGNGRDAYVQVAHYLSERFGWDKDQVTRDRDRFEAELELLATLKSEQDTTTNHSYM